MERAEAAAASAPQPSPIQPESPRRFPSAFALQGSTADARVVYRDRGRLCYVLGRDGSIRLFSLKQGGEVPIPPDLLPTVRALFP